MYYRFKLNMSKKIPQWVVQEFVSLSEDNMNQKVEKMVKNYVRGEFGGDSDHNKFVGDPEALIKDPKDFQIDGTTKTVGDVLMHVNNCYNIIVDINGKLQDNNIQSDDINNMSVVEIKENVGDKLINELQNELMKIPEPIRGHYASYHHSRMGGSGNKPTIGAGGDVMKKIYINRLK